MHIIDYAIFIVYMLAMLRVGVYFLTKTKPLKIFTLVAGTWVAGTSSYTWLPQMLAVNSMLFGGATTILLIVTKDKLPWGIKLPEHLDANL